MSLGNKRNVKREVKKLKKSGWLKKIWNMNVHTQTQQWIALYFCRYILIYTVVGVIKKWKYNESNSYAVAQLVEALRYKTESRGFDSRFTSGYSMTLASIQPLTEMITRNIPWGIKAVVAWGWQTYHVHVPPECLVIWEPQLSGTLGTCSGLYRVSCTLQWN
jgi:hypothetical protein